VVAKEREAHTEFETGTKGAKETGRTAAARCKGVENY